MANTQAVQWWLVQSQTRGKWTTQLLPGSARSLRLAQMKPEVVAVTAVDRYGNTSPAYVLEGNQ
jgi:hypothetical protein